MKILMLFVVGLLSQPMARAQGTTYLSNVDQPSVGSIGTGSNFWLAASFRTGTNADAYMLDTIRLGMTGASGNPSSFTVMLYAQSGNPGGPSPGSSLGTLTGSLSPITAGIYDYVPVGYALLSPQTPYFIVLTAGTGIADGTYNWSDAGPTTFYNGTGGWRAPASVGGVDNYQSADGLNWDFLANFPQFAIEATPVPEPGTLAMIALGALLLGWRQSKKRVL